MNPTNNEDEANVKPPVGTRAVAMDSSDKHSVSIFGYGVYIGDEIPDASAEGAQSAMARMLGVAVPVLRLDDGSTVYSTEAHCGPEEGFSQWVGDRELKMLSIEQVRKEMRDRRASADSDQPTQQAV